MSIRALVCAVSFYRAFKESSISIESGAEFLGLLKIWIVAMALIAFVFTHTGVVQRGGVFIPYGVVPGLIVVAK
jgi:hypothetical protein